MKPYDPKHSRCDVPEESTSASEKKAAYNYEVAELDLNILKVGDFFDAVTMKGAWMEVEVTNILEPGEIQNGQIDTTPTLLPFLDRRS